MGGVRNEVCRLSATSTPKNMGSTPKWGSSGRKIGTKMMMISLHSSGQPSRKMISWESSRKVSGVRFIASTNSLMSPSPPRYENTEENVHDPTKSQHTIAEVRAVRNTASLSRVQVKARYAMARTMAPRAPMAAASLGVASPKRIAPSTDRIRMASGKNACTSRIVTFGHGTLLASLESFGASDGLIATRATT
jgi:hypothetical protein